MEEFWNQRYATREYAYGTKPNEFFKSQLDQLNPGRILLPAEGEGRNAVYAAMKGWQVYAFDMSKEAMQKSEKLADRIGVTLNYQVADLENIEYEEKYFDALGLIYAHFPGPKRRLYHQKLEKFLKIEGTLIVEGFSKNQYKRSTGGPKNIEMLFDIDELRKDFPHIKNAKIEEEQVILNEGFYHQGMSSVIRMIGKRKL